MTKRRQKKPKKRRTPAQIRATKKMLAANRKRRRPTTKPKKGRPRAHAPAATVLGDPRTMGGGTVLGVHHSPNPDTPTTKRMRLPA